MTESMPLPQNTSQLPRNDSFSTEDIAKAFKASAKKPRNDLSLRIVRQDETEVPPPTPREYLTFSPPRDRKRQQT